MVFLPELLSPEFIKHAIGLARDGRYILRPRILVLAISLARISQWIYSDQSEFLIQLRVTLTQSVMENADVFRKIPTANNPEWPITIFAATDGRKRPLAIDIRAI